MTDVNDSDIAIVGMAIRVPDAANPQQFWSNLKGGVESVRTYTDEELIAKGVPASALADPNYVRAGIPLQDLDQFDPEFFGFSPKEAGILDPQHRQFMCRRASTARSACSAAAAWGRTSPSTC
jgi:acyl transferase domain-containing protein